jgi:hypothetical protein
MRSLAAPLTVLALLAAALLPGAGLAAPGGHGGHGAEGPANPMAKSVLLYLDGTGALAPAPAAAGTVPAGPSNPAGESTPVAWTVAATKNTRIDSSIFVELYAQVVQPTLVAGGPEGAAFEITLTKNGEPVEGARSLQSALSGAALPGEPVRMKLFLPQPQPALALAPGDTLGLQVRYFGVNPEAQPAVQYLVGGEQGSRMGFRLAMASLDELGLPMDQVGRAAVAPLDGFDFKALSKKDPAVKEYTLKAFQFGFHGGPVVVPNGSKVALHITVDESLSTSGEGHAGHGDHGAEGGAGAWDANTVAALHGFALPAFGVQTVAFDGLVTTLRFTADKPGNHTFLCTVFCGSGHGRMTDVLTVLGSEPLTPNGSGGTDGQAQTLGPAKNAPGFAGLAALGALGALAVALRRRQA